MEKIWKSLKPMLEGYRELALLALVGTGIGVIVGFVEVFYSLGLKYCISLYHVRIGFWLACLPLLGMLILWMFGKWGQVVRKGISLVFEISQGMPVLIPKRTIAMLISATWLSNLAGASVGREGVAIQIGAAVSHVIGRNLPVLKEYKTMFIVTGLAAGFAGLFGTPFTAVYFALEMLVAGSLKYRSLPMALCASFASARIASLFGLEKEAFPMEIHLDLMDWNVLWRLLVMGIAFGIIGGLFAVCMHKAKPLLSSLIQDPYKRMLVLGSLLALVLYATGGRYSNPGSNLMEAALEGHTVYAWDFAAKFILTVLSLSIGFVGGEVAPLFAIGSTLGAVLGMALGLPPIYCAALGYAAVFGAGTNTYLAAIMIGMEIFGFANFPYFFVICSIAYLLNRNQSIYSKQIISRDV